MLWSLINVMVVVFVVCSSFKIRRERIGYEKGMFKTARTIHWCKRLQFAA